MGWVTKVLVPVFAIAANVMLSSCTTAPPLGLSPSADAIPIALGGVVELPEVEIQQLPGTVTTDHGCIAMAIDGKGTYPVVWGPSVTVVDADTLEIDAIPIELGRRLNTALGHIVAASSLTSIIPDVESCVDSMTDPIAVLLAGVAPYLEGQ